MDQNIPLNFLNHLRGDREDRGDCPFCGWTRKQLQATGLVGCPLCYSIFEYELASSDVYAKGPTLE